MTKVIKKSDLAERLKQKCDQKHISISDLERHSGYSPGMLSRWSATTEDFNVLTKLVAMADYLDVSLDELLGRETSAPEMSCVVEFPSFDVARCLLNETMSQRLIWENAFCDGSPLSEEQIPDSADGRTLVSASRVRCEELVFILACYCDDLEDNHESVELALFCTAGHGLPIQKIDTADETVLPTLYIQLRMRQIFQSRESKVVSLSAGQGKSKFTQAQSV